MFNYAAFLVRRRRFAWIVLLSLTCLITSVEAQHGGGGRGGGGGHSGGGHAGGHSSGGHFGGGHSSHSRSTSGHNVGPFGWLHRQRGAHRAVTANISDALLAHWSKPIPGTPANPLSSTLIRTIPLESTRFATRKEPDSSSWLRHRPQRFWGRFPCPHFSGCYFNGFNQVCFFGPSLPILTSSVYFGFQNYGLDGDAMDQSGELAPTDTLPKAAAADTESENPPSKPPASVSPPLDFRGKGLDPRFFLLILKNGTERAVTDYWFADGYIEFVSGDGSRSHIPIEALDYQATVTQNSYRGLPFSVRSVSQEN